QAQLGRMIGTARGGEDFAPAVLGIAEDQRNESPGRVGRRAGGDRRRAATLLRPRCAAGENLRPVQQHARIDTEIPADQSDDDDRADAEPAAAARHSDAAANAARAIVFNVVAGPEIVGTHALFSCRVPALAPQSLSAL